MKILYVHGYGGKGNSTSSDLLRKALAEKFDDVEVIAPDFPLENYEEANRKIRSFYKNADIVVASSMGAFYTMQFSGKSKILINPALPDNIRKNIPEVSKELLDKFDEDLENFLVHCLDFEFRLETYVVLGTEDTVAPNAEFIDKHYYKSHIHKIPMEHKLDINGAREVVKIIEEIRGRNK